MNKTPPFIGTEALREIFFEDPTAQNGYSFYLSIGYSRGPDSRIYTRVKAPTVSELLELLNAQAS